MEPMTLPATGSIGPAAGSPDANQGGRDRPVDRGGLGRLLRSDRRRASPPRPRLPHAHRLGHVRLRHAGGAGRRHFCPHGSVTTPGHPRQAKTRAHGRRRGRKPAHPHADPWPDQLSSSFPGKWPTLRYSKSSRGVRRRDTSCCRSPPRPWSWRPSPPWLSTPSTGHSTTSSPAPESWPPQEIEASARRQSEPAVRSVLTVGRPIQRRATLSAILHHEEITGIENRSILAIPHDRVAVMKSMIEPRHRRST